MSPEAASSVAVLAALRAEIETERTALARCLADLADATARLAREPADRAALAFAAFALHGWYTGFESIAERVARHLDQVVPTGDRWHRDLVMQIAIEIPGVRPPLVAREQIRDLTALLGFRHFFRHAYGVDLDAQRIDLERLRLQRVAPMIDASLDAFDAFLARAITAVGA